MECHPCHREINTLQRFFKRVNSVPEVEKLRVLLAELMSTIPGVSNIHGDSPVGWNKPVRAQARTGVSGTLMHGFAGNATTRYAWVVLFRSIGLTR